MFSHNVIHFDMVLMPNQNSCDVFVYQRAAVVIFPIFYLVVFIISACSNSLVLYVICMEYLNFEGSRSTPYLLLLACFIAFCCPLTVIMGCYAKINLKLQGAAKQNSVTGRSRRNHRANIIILLILITFIICFGPYHLNIMQFMVRKIHHQPTCEELRAFKMSLQITVSLMNFNCCLDPVIYFFAIKTYKKRVTSLFKDYLYTSGASPKTTADNSSSNT